ncbi:MULTISPECIES: 30S ribosomal protein S12 methylthiotransferase RimO [unclassified Clostridium]|uniref:Ribosomal protein uS12 methylthiotransferase RimO n=1 Tax=Clostridium botulinum (strain Eklund 17B / Type B) TaxID=935198 RepID=RIMO_CLOBB|nr:MULTISPECIES: 30S ribosomal protein S12 methylthiotransferase RimO [unclassified Clostridium]B2TJ67.1 RecName: Full=Ribosomal protein uS12 methylthiotransferase RimO; Short=uS12 MTTase; Short=uS12 methylthiotransferase; AltName: Full=Ribosomal protein uS12 (aspartate-C(3))-methylthiotransferase; AltName: Full=Ribosome maturation factor RimO [Clostridium botulinum B str. Eklund 17B (NRP)]MBN1044951.1 30S ribosomal protein S12 methylthiotransferase RimO [Clostridium botulinum]ACD22764.1 conserv
MTKYKVGMVSLGCDKNRVDSEIILGKMSNEYEITNNAKEADVIIVNTCGFIESAKQESIDTILEMAEYKNNYKCKLLIATGCLIQRYGDELKNLIPEIDIMLGVNDYNKIDKVIKEFIEGNKEASKLLNYSDENINEGNRILTTQKESAYIRIAEGCNNFCTYCIIPKIRGKFRSRRMENIISEATDLASQGVKELILIAQDTTQYGSDIYGKKNLHVLLKELSKIEGIKWIRVLYCYPEAIYDELIEEIAVNEKVVKYLDIPIQHISDHVLKLMGRKTSKKDITDKIEKLRKSIPNIIIRTTFIVGFPQETQEDFEEILEFLQEYKLDKVGVFKYSREEDTPASKMDGQIDEAIKKEREEKLMLSQEKISNDINKLKVNKKYDILIEEYDGEFYKGRNFEMAPDIDGNVFFESPKNLEIGEFVKVKIIKNMDYDLIGVVEDESCK